MAASSRTAESRANQLRPLVGGETVGTLYVDSTAMSKDYELMWAAESVLGQDNRENVRLQMQQRGFMPVLTAELPSEAPSLFPGEKHDEHSLIRRGGQVLMKRLRATGAEERARDARENSEALRSVNRDFEAGIQGAPGMERLKDGGVQSRIEQPRKALFPDE